MPGKRDWPRETWNYPLSHDFTFGFGLNIDDAVFVRNSTIVPYLMQDNAIVDYETIKVNPENEDFAVVAKPNTAAGSFIPRVMVSWWSIVPSTEPVVMNFKTMNIFTSTLNRLDAFDKKTGNDIETILELTHETTDEQCYPLWNGTKLYESHMTLDYPADVPGLTTSQQPEGVAFDMEMYFDALHYYTNKEMLRQMTDRMKSWKIKTFSIDSAIGDCIKTSYQNVLPSMCKYQHPYTGCYGLFHCPPAATVNQFQGVGVTNVEHIFFYGRVRFNEFNPDFNRSRA